MTLCGRELRRDQTETIASAIHVAKGERVVMVETAGLRDLPSTEYNNNVYRVDAANKIIWQVIAGEPPFENDAFIYLERYGRNLRGQRFSGFVYLIDLKTGAATQVDWIK